MIALAIILSLFFRFGLRYAANPEVFQREVQNSIIGAEFEIKNCIATPQNYAKYTGKDLGVLVYSGDSLIYWNSNLVGPKLIRRRVPLNCDTISNLLCGDFLVKSFSKDNLSFYVYKLLNSTYSIENEYFENRYVAFPFLVDAEIKFDAKATTGYPIYNADNELLTYCEIKPNPTVSPSFRSAVTIIVLVCFIIGLILLLMSFEKVKAKLTGFSKKEHPKFIELGILTVLLISILLTYLFYYHQTKQENETIIETANRLIEKRDAKFEESYLNIEKSIQNDSTLREMIFAESNVLADVVLGYTQQLVFDDNMKSYTASLTICSPEEEITIQPEDYVEDCKSYFEGKLTENPNERVGENLYFIDYYTLDPNYLGIINIKSLDSTSQRTLYFEFYKPVTPAGFGYPKLLQDRNSWIANEYSVACYQDTLLMYKNGRYLFPSFLSDLNAENEQFSIKKDGKIYAKQYNENDTLVISVPRKGWSEVTAPFGVIFLALMIPFSLICLLLRTKQTPKQGSLRRKLQVLVLSTLVISFCAVGPISVIYMRSLYNKKTTTNQFETIRTLSLEMGKDIDFQQLFLINSRETWTEILHDYASTFFTDLNLYGIDGRLLATTREEIYEHFLQAPLMNAEAFKHMNGNKALYYVHNEKLGSGEYESAYVPITDHNGNTLAYLNTPFFSSKSDLQHEIAYFILTYINIILLLLALTIFFVLVITRRLTQPLAMLQDNMTKVTITGENEKIEWQSNDEIGALIKQYNQTLGELQKQKDDFQRITIEEAWRDAARQVAHEIKNTLTPMRLSLQMLQRSVDQGVNNLDERINHTSDTLIEQIDTLSDIASSFSDYAKLPKNDPKPLDLAELLGTVVNLYDNVKNITFTYDFDKSKDHTYVGDKTNLNSAISNVIKNAIQAIGSRPEGQIDVKLTATEQSYRISIKDNGPGIKEEDKKKVFLPNFTTKVYGSGIGLSYTYKIIQSAGGEIKFESEEGVGTEFIIELFK